MAETIATPNGAASLVRKAGSWSLYAGHRRVAFTWRGHDGKYRISVSDWVERCDLDFDGLAAAKVWLRDNAARLVHLHTVNEALASHVTALAGRGTYPDSSQHLSNLDLLKLLERVQFGDPKTITQLRTACEQRDALLGGTSAETAHDDPDPVDGLPGPVEADVLPHLGRGRGGDAC